MSMGVLLLLTAATLLAGCKTIEMESQWSAAEMKADGRTTDWELTLTGFLEDEGIALAVCNDAQRLYFLVRHNDPRWAQAIRRGGLTLWLDAKGGKNKQFMIRYRGGHSRTELGLAADTSQRRKMPPPFDERFADQPQNRKEKFTCYQEGRIVEKGIPVDGSEGPAAGFAIQQGIFTYEFSIPLQESAVRYYGIGAEPGQTISIGVERGDISRDELRRAGQGMGGPGGRGGRGGGRIGDGTGRGGRGGSRPMPPEKQEIWIKTILAAAPADVDASQ